MIISTKFIDIVTKTTYLALIFIGGICIGILLIMLIYLIISLIHKRIKTLPKEKMIVNNPIASPNKIILKYQKMYDEEYSNKIISQRLSSLKIISLDLIKDIATLYYPNSDNPMLEVSIESLLLLTHHVLDRIDHVINDIIESSAFKVVWAGLASFHNVTNFIKGIFKKEKEDFVKLNIRELKLSFVFAKLERQKDNPKQETKKEPLESKKYFLFDSYINNKLKELIKTIADEAILVYSNNFHNQLELTGEPL